jgi:hypothetical protein
VTIVGRVGYPVVALLRLFKQRACLDLFSLHIKAYKIVMQKVTGIVRLVLYDINANTCHSMGNKRL